MLRSSPLLFKVLISMETFLDSKRALLFPNPVIDCSMSITYFNKSMKIAEATLKASLHLHLRFDL